jgi:hypothetical protein
MFTTEQRLIHGTFVTVKVYAPQPSANPQYTCLPTAEKKSRTSHKRA